MPFVNANGVVLYYRLTGRRGGPRIVFVNSLGSDITIWDEVAANLEVDFELLVYDKPGHGLSAVESTHASIAGNASDLLALLDHVGWNRAAICGISVGGLIAMDIAVRAPQRLSHLVLMDTAARIGAPEMWNNRISKVKAGGVAAIADEIMARWFSPEFRQHDPDAFSGWQRMLERTSATGYCDTCAALRDVDLMGAIGRITTPTLVMAGEDDLSIPPDLVLATARQIPAASFQAIAGAGHLPCIERPSEVARLLRGFLNPAALGGVQSPPAAPN